MTVYDRLVQLLKYWPNEPVMPELKKIEDEYLSAPFAESVRLSWWSRPDRLVFDVKGIQMDGQGNIPPPKQHEIIAVWSPKHGVQVWEAGTDGLPCQAVWHMREALMAVY
jgi:hypothetical protein